MDEELQQAKDEIQMQINKIYEWFFEYDNQIKQYERNVRMGETSSYHIGDTEYTIEELDVEAKSKAEQITELKQQLENL